MVEQTSTTVKGTLPALHKPTGITVSIRLVNMTPCASQVGHAALQHGHQQQQLRHTAPLAEEELGGGGRTPETWLRARCAPGCCAGCAVRGRGAGAAANPRAPAGGGG